MASSPVTVVVLGKSSQMEHDSVKDIFLEATDKAVQKALEGLNTTTLGDPGRRSLLDDISKMLTGHIPEVAKVQGTLTNLIALSNKLEANQKGLQKEAEKENHVRTEIKHGIQSREEAVKTAARELSSAVKRRAEQVTLVETLKAQLEEASSVLVQLTENEQQLHKTYSSSESELNEQKERLQNFDIDHNQKFTESQQQATALKVEADQLMVSLQKWRSL